MLVEPFIPFLLLALALFATPGPATLSIAASGAVFGFSRTVYYILGLIVGMTIIFVMIALGLGLIFDEYPLVRTIFQWVSLLYMIYLAYKIATSPPVHTASAKPLGPVQGVLLNLVNPKAYFAVVALVSQFTQPGENYFLSFFTLMAWSLCFAFCTNLVWAYAGTFIARKLSSDRMATKINIGFAVLLLISIIWTMFLSG